ncbi:MAG TPA: hypothetical protein VF157_16285 [Chloroflexota bacterium]
MDVGSNTVHLLIADSNGRKVAPVDDQSTRLRLGEDVARCGHFQPEKVTLAIETMQAYAERAARSGAKTICLLGTQAVRAAANGNQFASDVEQELSLPLRVISPSTEAQLGYLGTTLDVPERDAHLVVDIGGGSTQLLLAKGGATTFVGSLAGIGSVTLPARSIHHDPPREAEREHMDLTIRQALGILAHPDGGHVRPRFGVIIGGAGRRIRRAGRLGPKEPLVRSWVQRMADAALAASTEMMDVFGAVRPEDADIVRTGALVLRHVMDAFDLQHCYVSDNGIREGAVLALARGEGIPNGD